ncbi:MBL fold metallo-hydrolase [Rhodococcus sp. IEGM 1379]|uniref:MBL fold metallo-hydrolase n=1 Tax=Rhodococcus sp. IEGM 1379 TaxID=3047086 RepID=UPI0024B82AB3|nr:MBL fold metallo-hydrolase [Rhodococcus sp. IEGM 1379]MDI9917306.1 MBL fold metallo-hydrolase [Rhodococcus sp. IEGM 1379]
MNHNHRGPHVVALGTAGGPRWWTGQGAGERQGIATAVVVNGSTYLVDCGHGVGRQLMLAGLPLGSLAGIFITHLHSDHTVDLASLTVFGTLALGSQGAGPVRIIGPGDRGMLPPVSAHASGSVPKAVGGVDTTPGVESMFRHLVNAYATDLNDRIFDTLRPSPYDMFNVADIEIPTVTGYHPNANPSPDMEPFEVYRDDNVTVTAVLVEHPPIAPAFAYRFDTAEGSVTISGDTAPCDNLVRLASHTDLLMHEAIDFDSIRRGYQHESPAAADAGMEHHRKSHTSARQAGEIATRSHASRLALHHLVPGTADPTEWWKASETFDGELFVPADLDIIPFHRIPTPPADVCFDSAGTPESLAAGL